MNTRLTDFLKKIANIIFAIVLLPALCFGCIIGELMLSWNPFVLWGFQQSQLARELKVSIADYPNPSYFPLGYYEDVLSPGTDISVAHQTIIDYKKVLRCKNREVYYYFSSGESYSLRIEVWYNDDLTVSSINGEDEDSRSIGTEACIEGRLAK